MGLVMASLATMGMCQILLASVFLGSYALALGDFAGALGRRSRSALRSWLPSALSSLATPGRRG
jgi:hypothetical protein